MMFNLTSFAEPANLSLLKKEVEVYHDSGLYEQELAKIISEAQTYIVEQSSLNARKAGAKKLALVLDIDETSLSNYKNMARHGFAFKLSQAQKEILAANSPAILPTLSLYNKARELGVAVFFVTGRPGFASEATKTNLLNAGYKDWAGLYLRPDNYGESSIIPFKTQTREAITKQGYTIIASIGDQESDIKGGFCKKGFKLPNPYYYLP